MTNRERALEVADNAIAQVENGNIVPDTQELLGYALILVLADISKQLEDIQETISVIYVDGVGVG